MKWLDKTIGNKMIFRLLYLFVTLSFGTILKGIPGIHLLNKALIAWGVVLILIELYKIVKFKKPWFVFIMYGFLLITLILNIFIYFNGENIKIWLINAILIFVVFGVDLEKSKEELLTEMNIFSIGYLAITSVLVFISVVNKGMGKTVVINQIQDGVEVVTEYAHLFANENAFGICAGIAVVVAIYLSFAFKEKWAKIICLMAIIVNILGVFESHGRSALIMLIAIPVVMFLIVIRKNFIRIPIVIIPLLVVINYISKNLSDYQILNKLLSGRERMWARGAEVIKENLNFGVGNYKFVDKMIESGQYNLPGLQNGGMHNVYLQVLVVNGLYSFITFIIFLGCMLLYMINVIDRKNWFLKAKYGSILAIIVGLLGVNLLESNIVYMVSFISVIFWTYSGYLSAILYKEKGEEL